MAIQRPGHHTYHCSACNARHREDTNKVLLVEHNLLICWRQFVAGWEPDDEKGPSLQEKTRG